MGFDKDALRNAAVHLRNWQLHGGDNFHSLLFHLISKAYRAYNYYALNRGFPYEVAVYDEWCNSDTPEEFYRKYGL